MSGRRLHWCWSWATTSTPSSSCTPRFASMRCVLLVPRSAGPAQVADIVARTGASFGVAPGWSAADEVELRWIDVDGPCDRGSAERTGSAGRRTVVRVVHLGHHVEAQGRDPLAEHADEGVDQLHRGGGTGRRRPDLPHQPARIRHGRRPGSLHRARARRTGGPRGPLGACGDVRSAADLRRDVVRRSRSTARPPARRGGGASRRGAAARGVPGRHRAGPAHRRAHRGRLRHHRHACLRLVGGAGEHVGPADRAARRPARRRRGDAGRRRGEGRAPRRNRPSAASEGRTRSWATPMPTTIRRPSTGTGSAPATSPTSSTGECASSGASRTS